MPTKPKLGQNFLHDVQAIHRIAAAIGDCTDTTVIEIGPGRGAVTQALLSRTRHVIAVELDAELAAGLRADLPADKVTVIEQDVLQFDFAAAATESGGRPVVVGNLPYYITSPILRRLAENHAVLDRAVLMMQREVADRVCAGPGSRDYGLLSVTVQMYGDVEKLFTLPPGAFSPPPQVHSTVIRWRFAPRFQELGVDETRFPDFVRTAFAQKRKTLANNLRAAGVAPETIARALPATEIDLQARAEVVSIKSLAALWKNLAQTTSPKP